MADSVTAQDSGQKFSPHPEGQFAAVCADVIDLGQRVEQYAGQPARIVQKCALVFLTTAEGETTDVSSEVTVSMNERATLRGLLEAWRGKSYTPEQAAAGVPLHKLVGVGALISVEHKKSAKGRSYAKIKTIAPLPKEMTAPSVNGYARPDFWAQRKKQYADEAARFQQTIAKSSEPEQPVEEDEDGPLPF